MSELNLEFEDFIEFSNNFSEELRSICAESYAATKKIPGQNILKDITKRSEEKLSEFYDLPNRIKHEGQLEGFDAYRGDIKALEGFVEKLKKKIRD